MTAIEFNQKLAGLLDEAGKSQIPLGQVVAALELTKVELIMDTIGMSRRMQAIVQAQKLADQTPKIVSPN